MTEDERDWCIGLQQQARDWWKRAQHHVMMRETAKNWDSHEYAGIHAKLDQQYAYLAHAKALELLCAEQPKDGSWHCSQCGFQGFWKGGPHDCETQRRKDAARVAEALHDLKEGPDLAERKKLALKLAKARGAP